VHGQRWRLPKGHMIGSMERIQPCYRLCDTGCIGCHSVMLCASVVLHTPIRRGVCSTTEAQRNAVMPVTL
jgi:hypothetical protein